MIAFLEPLLADISNLPWVAIISIIGGFLISIIGMIAGLWAAQRKQQLWHETARLALEKGQPLPAMPEEVTAPSPTPAAPAGPGRDLRAGLILIAVGAGLYLFLNALVGPALGLVGAIPGFIGVALLLYAAISAIFRPASPAVQQATDAAVIKAISSVRKSSAPDERS